MTESDWLASADPAAMLAYLQGKDYGMMRRQNIPSKISDRKLRLFAIAVARHGGCGSWANVGNIIQAAEGLADGIPFILSEREWAEAQRYAASWLLMTSVSQCVERVMNHYESDPEDRETGPAQAALLREIVGNPFRPVKSPRSVINRYMDEHWWTDQVQTIAQSIYDRRSLAELPILADALSDAGCDNVDLLAHLRGQEPCRCLYGYAPPGNEPQCRDGWRPLRAPHVLGCWALDLLLGKE